MEHKQPARFAYMDGLRIAAVFLVIVNHTNSYVFKAAAPVDITWWMSVAWYYFSKIGVPLFVMVSGACLLPKVDTYAKTGKRLFRIGLVLVIFSYLYFMVNVLQSYGGVRDVFNLLGFAKNLIREPITDSFWYLYFYLGLMLMLPWLQRMAKGMEKRDVFYFILISLVFGAVWPLAEHYVPALAITDYFSIPLFSTYIGIFFAGHYLHSYIKKVKVSLALMVIVLSIAASVMLTHYEYQSLGGVGQYWFMDDRMMPSIFVILCSAGVYLVSREWLRLPNGQAKSRLQTLGGCAFGIYLVQDFIIEQTRYVIFQPMSQAINPFLAALLWEIGIFAVALMAVWLLRLLPGVKKLL